MTVEQIEYRNALFDYPVRNAKRRCTLRKKKVKFDRTPIVNDHVPQFVKLHVSDIAKYQLMRITKPTPYTLKEFFQ